MTIQHRPSALAALGLCLLLAVACSDSTTPALSSGGSPFDPVLVGPAREFQATHLTIAIHDAPASEVREAWVTFAGASVHAAHGNWVPVAGPFPATVDLLTLVGGRTFVLANSDVPAGRYDALRIDVSAARVVGSDGATHEASLPENGMSVEHVVGLDCTAGNSLTVTLDFQVAPSFALAAGSVAFTPTIVTDTIRVAR